MENMSFWQLVKLVPLRIMQLVDKLISFKVAVLAVATWLCLKGTLDSWHWLVLACVIVLGREFVLKMLPLLKK